MSFPARWISWIQAVLSSAFFSFLINGHTSPWISSSRGVRRGDHLSPLLFLLTSQTLSAILNKALNINLVHGFYRNLPRNFNHLMFVDDLILVTKASQKIAKNCLLCLIASLVRSQTSPSWLSIFPLGVTEKLQVQLLRFFILRLGIFPSPIWVFPSLPKDSLLVSLTSFQIWFICLLMLGIIQIFP